MQRPHVYERSAPRRRRQPYPEPQPDPAAAARAVAVRLPQMIDRARDAGLGALARALDAALNEADAVLRDGGEASDGP